jgi:hypothetical protein
MNDDKKVAGGERRAPRDNDKNLPVGGRHRRPTPEEMKEHEATKADRLMGIRKAHAVTRKKVAKMSEKPIFVDRG